MEWPKSNPGEELFSNSKQQIPQNMKSLSSHYNFLN